MKLPIYQVDAFASRPFAGNPAAVVPLERFLVDELMQAIAAENNLSETAFFVAEGEGYRLRWFTPNSEVDLCGHATLASGWVVLHRLAPGRDGVTFETRSGTLRVDRVGERLALDLPATVPTPADPVPGLVEAMGTPPAEVLDAPYWVLVYTGAAEVAALQPDFRALAELEKPVCATAPGGDRPDFVSRFFAPMHGIDEDPVTGSAHALTTPLWAERLGRGELVAHQISKRGGAIECRLRGERVTLVGDVAPYLEGTIDVTDPAAS